MDQKSAFYLKVLFNRHHKGALEDATKLLSPTIQQALANEKTAEKEISHAFRDPEALLNRIHYSWIAVFLSSFPEEKKLFYLAALPEMMQGQTAKLLGIEQAIPAMKKPLKTFIAKELILKILPPDHTPLPYLPPSSLDPLLNISKSELIHLIHYLGFYDLAEEMKKTVDTKLLKNIRLVLDPKEQEFLKNCMKGKDKIHTPRFPLNDRNGDVRELTQRLHKRGLLRLAKALANQSPSFVWHVTHMLDVGRGKHLMEMIGKEIHPQISALFTEQVLHLIKFLEKGKIS